MLKASNDFINDMSDGKPIYSRVEVILTDGTVFKLDGTDFSQNTGFQINTAISSETSFDIGGCVTGELRLKILNYDGKFDPYSFDKAQVTAWVYMDMTANGNINKVDAGKYYSPSSDIIDAGDVADMENVDTVYDGELFTTRKFEEVKKGVFYVDEQNFNNSIVTLVCYDKMNDFNTDYTGGDFTMSASGLVNYLAGLHGLVVKNSRFNNSTLQLTVPSDQKYTEAQILAYILQCTGNFAKIDEDGYLDISWYDVGKIDTFRNINAGTFKNPSEDSVDAGDVADMDSVENAYSGGTYEERSDSIYINHFFSHTVDVDDVTITGVRTILDDEDETSVLAGEEGYVLEIKKNPFITTDNQQDITERVWLTCQGLVFRPMELSILNNPLLQTGDIVEVEINGNTYIAPITYLSYTQGAYTQFKAAAESPTKNAQKLSSTSLTVGKANRIVDTKLNDYDVAIQAMTNLIAQAAGVYETRVAHDDGSYEFILHNKSTLETSTSLWKMTADGFAVSNDGGETWNSGWDSNGNAVMNVLSVIGIKFDWAKGGTLTLGGSSNVNGVLTLKDANGNTVVTMNANGITVSKGSIDASKATITNLNADNITSGTIKGRAINTTSDAFYVTQSGYMHCSSGDVGGFSISASSLKSSYSSLSSNTVSASNTTLSSSGVSTSSGGTSLTTSSGSLLWGSYTWTDGETGSSEGRTYIRPSLQADIGASTNSSAWWDVYCGGGIYTQVGVFSSGLYVGGSQWSEPTKDAVIDTVSYGKRALRCYETATPLFGDLGRGKTDDSGVCYVYLDDIFLETINTNSEYNVFLQKYGEGDLYVAEIQVAYFVVKGTPNLEFAWEIKCNQIANNSSRLDTPTELENTEETESNLLLYTDNINRSDTSEENIKEYIDSLITYEDSSADAVLDDLLTEV